MKRRTLKKTRQPKSPRSKRAKNIATRHAVGASKTPPKKQTAAVTTSPDAITTLVAANAQALGLTLEPAWYRGISFNLGLILRLAGLVEEFQLPDDAEPAPVFRA